MTNQPQKSDDLIVLYGTLMKGFKLQDELEIREKLEFISECTFSGDMYSLGAYPAIVDGVGTTTGELYKITDPLVLPALDVVHHFDQPDDSENNIYQRKKIKLAEPKEEAWIYWYSGDVEGLDVVPSGSWYEYSLKQQVGKPSELEKPDDIEKI